MRINEYTSLEQFYNEFDDQHTIEDCEKSIGIEFIYNKTYYRMCKEPIPLTEKPVLSNGKALRLSWRGWGGVMAIAYNLKTDNNDYNYILWYMGEYAPEERSYPKKDVGSYKDQSRQNDTMKAISQIANYAKIGNSYYNMLNFIQINLNSYSKNSPIISRDIFVTFMINKIYKNETNGKCCLDCVYTTIQEEDLRFLYEKATKHLFV